MSNEAEASDTQVGPHTVRYEAPDLFIVRAIGDVSADNLAEFGKCFKTAPGKFYVILDTTHMGTWDTAIKSALKHVPVASGIAIVGASRQMQLVLSILNKVYMMVNLGKDSPLTFVASEEEARAWTSFLRQGKTK